MGRCVAPCDGRTDIERYGELVRSLLSSLTSPGGLLEALEERMSELAAQERFEEAALARDRLRALAEWLARSRADDWLLGAGELVLRDVTRQTIHLVDGSLVRNEVREPLAQPCPRDRADELAAVRAFLARNPVRLEHTLRPLAEPVDGGAALHRLLSRLQAVDRRPTGEMEDPRS
jgi:excinuclease UvrABC nuclease subunit